MVDVTDGADVAVRLVRSNFALAMFKPLFVCFDSGGASEVALIALG
jgi:hypothetical protein